MTDHMLESALDKLSSKNLSREDLLVELSVVRKAYSVSDPRHDFNSEWLRTTRDRLLPLLFRHLSSGADQLSCFCASKALLAVLLHSDASAKWVVDGVEMILQMVADCLVQGTSRVAASGLQLVKELLKFLRKAKQVSVCSLQMELLESKRKGSIEKIGIHWSRIIHALAEKVRNAASSASDAKRPVDQVLFELLSLTLECQRSLSVSYPQASNAQSSIQTATTSASMYQESLLQTLEPLCQFVLLSHCVLSFTKLLNVASKLTKSPDLGSGMVVRLRDTFCCLAASRMTHSSLEQWFGKEGSVVLQLAMRMCGREAESPPCCDLSMDDRAHGTVVRKYLLLAFRVWTVTTSMLRVDCSGSNEALAIPMELLPIQVIHHLCFPSTTPMASQTEVPICIRRVLLCAIGEQDSCLVETLLAFLRLHQFKDFLPSFDRTVINVHWMFLEFLCSIAFDHSVLLDFVVSSETDFDSFLLQYLELLGREKQDLVAVCSEHAVLYDVGSVESSTPSSTSTDKSTATPPGTPEATEHTPMSAKRLKLESPLESCDSDVSHNDSQSNEPLSHCYQQLTGCFFRLYYSLAKTLQQRLVPQKSKTEMICTITESLDKFLDC